MKGVDDFYMVTLRLPVLDPLLTSAVPVSHRGVLGD